MDDITMEIRTRLDQRFSQYQPSRALTELKEELVGDLTEAVTDKVNQGQAAALAVDEAMAQLGDIDALLKEVAAEDAADGSADDATERDVDDSQVKIGKLKIHGDKVTWGHHVLVDGENDKVDFGKLVKVDGDHVSVAGGMIDVQGDDVYVNGERPRRTFVESLRLVNTQSFNVADLAHVDLSYRDAAVKLGPANADEIVINEYMSRDNARYYLRAERHGDLLTIKQGDRPRLWPNHVRAEIFLPANLAAMVGVHAGNGSLEISDLSAPLKITAHAINGSMRAFDDHVSELLLKSTNGAIRLDQVHAAKLELLSKNGSVTSRETSGTLKVDSRNGAIKLADHTGDVDLHGQNGAIKLDGYTGQAIVAANNGAIKGRNFTGGGTFHAGNGNVNVQLAGLTDDFKVEAGGSVTLQMPLMTDYRLDLKSKHDRVREPQEAQLSLNDDSHKIGTVGDQPEHAISVYATSGSVRVS
ncbi:DUF4097 family beta strand repeat-containing protein [Levilactobacillus yonginensis]|uniref:DUF4097 family beta strand repeat-containing protein n=1 Tax=Levilactobacillus yonginensis TaxID=1054041 RepID=UPI000F7A94F0|nr:DUF4097 family beta strand repeat-containing protein [Levilactobacillus yonginensis]